MAGRDRGYGWIELLAVVAVLALLVAGTVPTAARMRNGARTSAAARQFALDFHALRWRSIARNRAHGLFFERDGPGWRWTEVVDGNGNGIRTEEILDGTDPRVGGARSLRDRPGVLRLGFPDGGPFPRIPPRTGTIERLDDPVRFGRSDVVSFSPRGSSSSGTLYLTDGREELFGVLVYGVTGRVRVWRFRRESGEWAL